MDAQGKPHDELGSAADFVWNRGGPHYPLKHDAGTVKSTSCGEIELVAHSQIDLARKTTGAGYEHWFGARRRSHSRDCCSMTPVDRALVRSGVALGHY